MIIAESELLKMRRPDLLQLAKLIAQIGDKTLTAFTADIMPDASDEDVKNIGRQAIPTEFRVGLHQAYLRLSPLMQSALAEKFLPPPSGAMAVDDAPSLAFDAPAPGLDTTQFSIDAMANKPDWGEMHFLLMRLHKPKRKNDDIAELRVSYMTIRHDPLVSAFPTFETVRRVKATGRKAVKGIVLASGTDIYTIGQLTSIAGLRFTRLKLYHDHQDGQLPHINLYGIRLGLHNELTRPFAHLVFARQLRRGAQTMDREDWMRAPSGIYRATHPDLKRTIPEIDDIVAKLHTTPNDEGLLPSAIELD